MLAAATTLVGASCTTSQPACSSCPCVVPAGAATAVNAKAADALRETLLDERRAGAFYTSVMDRYGQVRPFSNVVHAEKRHAAVIESLMTRHGVAIPNDAPTNLPAVPGTLAECNRLAAQLERDNIAMYDRVLTDVSAPDIRAAFENLRAASLNNHLPAFERWSASAGPASAQWARGYAYGRGGGYRGYGLCRGLCATAP
jgi:hypothetical protein